MVVGGNRVYGRRRVIELVRELMTRESRDGSLRNQRFPILVVEGFPGTGKTALVAELADLLDQRVPYARLDFEANKQASVPQVLSALAFALSRRCPRYGALRFPRFIVGQLVMQLDLDLADRARARQQVIDVLKRRRRVDDVTVEVLTDTAGAVLDTMGSAGGMPVRPLTRWLRPALTWLAEQVLRRRLVLGPFQKWYGHRDLGLLNNSIDVLIDLNVWATDAEDEGNRRRIDELLWTAFLADLRAEFGRRRWADERALNCVVLLDNADTDLARRFLNQLVRIRRERAVGEQDEADPLTVVAASRGTLLAGVAPTDLLPAVPDHPPPGQLPDSRDWSRFSWLRYRLSDLTEDEVGRAVTDMALAWGDNQCLTRLVHQLTGGHPASTRLLLDAVARSAPRAWFEPEALLGQVRTDATSPDAPAVEDQMLDRLLGDVSNLALRDLVTCSAARERERALMLAGQDDLLLGGQASYGEVLDPILWPTDGSAGSVLLRRLLRRRLALRDSATSAGWSQVYDRLCRICRAEGDEAGELYYTLAKGELGAVTRRLHQLLAESLLDSTAWSDLLTSVTTAPHQHPRRQAPIDEVRTVVSLAGLDESLTSVGLLVAALWIAADPFTDSRRRHLHWQIAADYTEVSRLCPDGPHVVFLEAARRHSIEAQSWN